MMKFLIRLCLIHILISCNLWAAAPAITWYTQDANKKPVLQVEMFLASTCPHCHKADAFFKTLEPTTPWLKVTRHVIDKDKKALILFNQLLIDQGMTNDFAVPSIYFCNARWVGFANAQTSGKELMNAINYCKQDIEKTGQLTQNTVTVLRQQAKANRAVQIQMANTPDGLKPTLVIGLANMINTCSIFCLLAFLSLLFLQDKSGHQFLLGLMFIGIISLMHYFQQAYMAKYFTMLSWMRIPAALVGIFTLYLARLYDKDKANLFLSYLLTLLLALMIGVYQQICASNWSYFFEQWLYRQHFNSMQIGLYEIIYQALYVLPLVLVLIFYLIFVNLKRLKGFKRILRPVGIFSIAVIAIILIVYPFALASMSLSILALILLPICTWIWRRYIRPTKPSNQN